MKKLISVISACSIILSTSPHALAQNEGANDETKKESSESSNNLLFKSLDYPELQVVPKASERVFLEAKAENDTGYLVHWPLQVSAIATLVAGLSSSGSYAGNDPNPSDAKVEQSEYAAMTATGIGAGWLVGTYLLSAWKPYKTSLSGIKKIKTTDRRNELLRERMSEEALQHQAELIETLRFLSVTSNFLASTWVLSQSSERAATIAAVSAGLAFLPWIFPHRQIDAYKKHLEYKRKIYSPISSFGFGVHPDTAQLAPQWTLNWSF